MQFSAVSIILEDAMNWDLSFTDFRGFHNLPFVPIRPLTILTGENSSGKTSFLAGLKYARDFFSMSAEASFNGDPFQLGTFDQIAHNRGGRAGRAKEFKIRIRMALPSEIIEKKNRRSGGYIISTLTFRNFESGAVISNVQFNAGKCRLNINLNNESTSIEFKGSDGVAHDLSDVSPYGSISRGDVTRYLSYIFHDFRYFTHRLEVGGREEEVKQAGMDFFYDALETFISGMSQEMQASSAIRTKPLRTYTPGFESEDGEGSHVPFELAKLARKRNKTEWERLKSDLSKFGIASNMFHEISVKSFGQSASDPFQIQFSNSGPKMNMVDLGYGTSQVLPILYSSSRANGPVNFIVQQPEVHLHAKAQAALGQFFVDAFLDKQQGFVLETHSDFILDRVRLAVSAGQVRKEDVSILFFDKGRLENKIHRIELGDDGEPVSPPNNYRDFFVDEQMKMMGF